MATAASVLRLALLALACLLASGFTAAPLSAVARSAAVAPTVTSAHRSPGSERGAASVQPRRRVPDARARLWPVVRRAAQKATENARRSLHAPR